MFHLTLRPWVVAIYTHTKRWYHTVRVQYHTAGNLCEENIYNDLLATNDADQMFCNWHEWYGHAYINLFGTPTAFARQHIKLIMWGQSEQNHTILITLS